METIDVCYAINKTGTYIQFLLPVHTCELSELNMYDKFLRKKIREDFEVLFNKYGADFSTEASYVLTEGKKMGLCSCLVAETSEELKGTLRRLGFEKRNFEL